MGFPLERIKNDKIDPLARYPKIVCFLDDGFRQPISATSDPSICVVLTALSFIKTLDIYCTSLSKIAVTPRIVVLGKRAVAISLA